MKLLDAILHGSRCSAKLPAILDSFSTSVLNTTSDHIGVEGEVWWGATKWQATQSVQTEYSHM